MFRLISFLVLLVATAASAACGASAEAPRETVYETAQDDSFAYQIYVDESEPDLMRYRAIACEGCRPNFGPWISGTNSPAEINSTPNLAKIAGMVSLPAVAKDINITNGGVTRAREIVKEMIDKKLAEIEAKKAKQ